MWISAGPGLTQHADDLRGRVAAHDRVVDDDEALAGDDLGHRVELQPQAVLAQLLAGLDEGPLDVAVLDEAVVLGQAAGAGEAARGRVAGVGHRDHEVGVDGRLAGEDLAHPAAHDLQRACRPCASPGARSRCTRTRRTPRARPRRPGSTSSPSLADRDDLARTHVAHILGADDVEGARLAGDAIARRISSESGARTPIDERAQSGRVAHREHVVLCHQDRRERAHAAAACTAAAASSIRSAGCDATSAAMISESEVEANPTPSARSAGWSSTALIRLPLWASASSRRLPPVPAARCTGCEFSHAFEPVVE